MSKMGHVSAAASHAQMATPAIHIRIRGLPEHVQRIADALEVALPGAMEWDGCAQSEASSFIEVSGKTGS